MPQRPKPLDDTVSTRAWFGLEVRNWRRVRRLSSAALGAKVNVSGTLVERIEKGERSCNERLTARFDEALDAGGALNRLWRRVEEEATVVPSDADKTSAQTAPDGFRAAPAGMLVDETTYSDGRPSDVNRRSFVAVSGLAAIAPGSVAGLVAEPSLPKSVRPSDIAQVGAAADTLAGWDNLFGGAGIVRSTWTGQLAWAKGLLNVPYPPSLEASLFTAVGRLAVVIGASAFDAYAHKEAEQLLNFGTWCAEQANNWHLRATALNWRARQAVWCGHPDVGLTLADNGLVRSDRLTPREQAMLHNARARAWARMGRPQETLTAIGQSDDIFSTAQKGEDVPWMAYYDDAQHHGDTGHAAFDIALLPGQSPTTARTRLQRAIDGHTGAYVRSRALSGTKLATLLMLAGEPQEAAVIASRALDEVGKLQSKRALTDVRDLAKAGARYARRPDVAGMRARIRSTVLV
ncbi:helix-turn-helix domain-containing protein [Streptomyces sp. NPDC056831]|uniref:helix-turn-helix domain-containing protein n=1 Tax=Streptomyces sp. NPDC056831 TaxID=3345954 RepID=UPI003685710B